MVDPFLPDADKVAALREALPATGAGIYLDTATAGPLPSEIVLAAREVEDWDLRTGRVGEGQREETLQRLDETRAVLAALIGADSREVALTHGLPAGLAAAMWSLDWRPGDRILAADGLSDGAMAAVVGVVGRMRLELDVLGGSIDQDDGTALARLAEAIQPVTRAVVLPHVAPRSGAAWPVARAAAIVKAEGAWLLVDGSHAAGAVAVDVAALDVDAYAFASHHWLLGPEGLGTLWVGERLAREGRPAVTGPLGFETLLPDGSGRAWPDARGFETGPFHRPSVVALGRAVGWLEMYLGLSWLQERVARLAGSLAGRLADVTGVVVLTPLLRLAGIVTFRIEGWTPEEALDELARRVFAMASAVAVPAGIRLSVGAFNTEHELERFAEGVAELALHTPATLPRRPTLVVLREGARGSGLGSSPNVGPPLGDAT
jgi:L-cysteine/cystine lyase